MTPIFAESPLSPLLAIQNLTNGTFTLVVSFEASVSILTDGTRCPDTALEWPKDFAKWYVFVQDAIVIFGWTYSLSTRHEKWTILP